MYIFCSVICIYVTMFVCTLFGYGRKSKFPFFLFSFDDDFVVIILNLWKDLYVNWCLECRGHILSATWVPVNLLSLRIMMGYCSSNLAMAFFKDVLSYR